MKYFVPERAEYEQIESSCNENHSIVNKKTQRQRYFVIDETSSSYFSRVKYNILLD